MNVSVSLVMLRKFVCMRSFPKILKKSKHLIFRTSIFEIFHDGVELCERCNRFYHSEKTKFGYVCRKNECKCPNGFASALCIIHGDWNCKACHSFYVLKGKVCEILPDEHIRNSILGNLQTLDRQTLQRIVKVMDPYYGERMDICLGDSWSENK